MSDDLSETERYNRSVDASYGRHNRWLGSDCRCYTCTHNIGREPIPKNVIGGSDRYGGNPTPMQR